MDALGKKVVGRIEEMGLGVYGRGEEVKKTLEEGNSWKWEEFCFDIIPILLSFSSYGGLLMVGFEKKSLISWKKWSCQYG